MKKNNILNKIIENKQSCLIIPHQSPDGDCLGSSYALSKFLTLCNCQNDIVIDEVIPTNYLFLKTENMLNSDDILTTSKKYDYVIILDTSSPDRVGAKSDVLKLASQILVIDHHKTNLYFGDENIVEMLSSVGEILYNLMINCDVEITQDIAKGLYTSIVTDTGEFRYSNTEASTLKVVAELFDTGFDFESVNRKIYSNQPLAKILLKSNALSQMKLHHDGRVAFVVVTQEMLKELSCEMYHTDGIVEACRDIEGVEVSILFKELSNNKYKVSMRSKEYVDVSEISLSYSGGGHARAAGCTIELNLSDIETKLLKKIEEQLS